MGYNYKTLNAGILVTCTVCGKEWAKTSFVHAGHANDIKKHRCDGRKLPRIPATPPVGARTRAHEPTGWEPLAAVVPDQDADSAWEKAIRLTFSHAKYHGSVSAGDMRGTFKELGLTPAQMSAIWNTMGPRGRKLLKPNGFTTSGNTAKRNNTRPVRRYELAEVAA